jgi:hypothetical protein
MASTIHYKVKNKTTGLYHKGGIGWAWSKTGKTWDTIGKLRSFITNYMKYGPKGTIFGLDQFVIVELLITESAEKEVSDILDPKKLIEFLSR